MSNYRDLSYYHIHHYEAALNIGFNDDDIKRARGPIPDPKFLEKLFRYVDYPLNGVRGGRAETIVFNDREFTLGFAEIRVLSGDGRVYAAPNTVIARVSERRYTPPEAFVSAVLNGPDPESETYQAYLARYDEAHCWGASDEYIALVDKAEALIRAGDADGLRAFLGENPAALSLVARQGTLLNEAVLTGQEGVALDLIEAGIPLDLFDGAELLLAAEKGMAPVVMQLLDRGAPLDPDQPRDNPLFVAISRNQNDLARQLYESRKDLVRTYTTQNSGKFNIMQWCKICKNEEFLRYLQNRFRFL